MVKHDRGLWLVLTLALTVAAAQAGPMQVRYYAGGDMVVVNRFSESGASAVESAVRALVAGPTAGERAAGLISAIPAKTEVVGVQVDGEQVTVELSDAVLEGLDESALWAIFDQFKSTLGDFPEILAIRLNCQGQLLSTYLPKSRTPVPPIETPDQGGLIPAAPEATAGLSGISVTIGPSHGRYWNGSGWYWQRSDPCGYGEAVLEDTNSIRLMQFLYQYLAQDSAVVHVPRELNESNCCHSGTGLGWWKMAARYWLQANGLPSSVWDSSTTDLNDDIRCRPLFADYRGTNIYIAHHTNAAGGTGTETFRDTAMEHPAHETNSYNLALNVHNNCIDAIRNMYDSGWANRGVKDSAGGFGEIRIPNRPACLIELAFHDRCDKDANYLKDNFFRSVSEWGVYKGVCAYFGRSATWDKYSCEFVSDTIPTTMTAGQSYNVNVVFRNRGVLWVSSRAFKLGAVGDSDPFAGTRHNVSGEIKPGSTYTFSFTMTAPTTPGTYTTDWQMLREGVAWFGPTRSKQVTVSGPPTVTAHPSNASVCPGASANFTVTATGAGTLSYQWQFNNADISNGGHYAGATTATLTVSNVDGTIDGNYRCRVSNSVGSTNSNNAALTLKAATAVTAQPTAKSVCEGQSAAFTIAASGEGAVSYQWQRNSVNISNGGHYAGATTATLTVSNVDASVLGSFRCVATAGCGSANSSGADLSLKAATAVTQQPVELSRCTGQSASFTVAAAGEGSVGYQWQKDGQNLSDGGQISGATAATLQIAVVEAADAGLYRCVVTAGCGSVTSDEAQLTILAATTVTQEPLGQEVCSGGVANFVVAGSGEGAVGYQWQKDGVDLIDGGDVTGAATASLQIAGADAGDVGQYRCVVTADCGSTMSAEVALALKEDAGITSHPQGVALCPGQQADLSVSTSGAGPFSYVWFKDGAPIPGAPDSSSYSIPAVIAADGGDYSVQVSGACGSPVVSDVATLTVQEDASIVADPASLVVCPNGVATFNVSGGGSGPLHYLWLKNGVPIPGAADAPSYTISNVGLGHAGAYSVRITGACGPTVESQAATLQVNERPQVVGGYAYSLVVDTLSTCPVAMNSLVLEASDPENETLAWQVKSGAAPTLGTVLFPGGQQGTQVEICYDPAGPEGFDSFVVEVADPCGSKREITVDVLVMPLARITSWASVQTHGSVGEIAPALQPDKTDSDIGLNGPVSEPALAGLKQVRVTFSEPVVAADGSLDAADVAVLGTDGVNPPAAYAPVSVSLSGGGTILDIGFAALPDQSRYTIDLTDSLVSQYTGFPVGGDTDCQVRALAGDTNGDGRINLIDVAVVKTQIYSLVGPGTARSDVNLDGQINLIDLGATKMQFGHEAP